MFQYVGLENLQFGSPVKLNNWLNFENLLIDYIEKPTCVIGLPSVEGIFHLSFCDLWGKSTTLSEFILS